jgi:DNA-binding IclR family transcriptional regulator
VKQNQSIQKAVGLLRQLAAAPDGLSTSALASATRLSRPTASRLLATLEQQGFVDRALGDGRYVLGYEMARIGRVADPHRGLQLRSAPVLRALADWCGESVTLSVPAPDGGLDLIDHADGPHIVGVSRQNWIGSRYPLHASASGKVFLAHLSELELAEQLTQQLERYASRTITSARKLREAVREVREQGFAVIEDELEDGLAALAVPVRDASGGLQAILTITGPTYRLDALARERVLAAALEDAAALGRLFAS